MLIHQHIISSAFCAALFLVAVTEVWGADSEEKNFNIVWIGPCKIVEAKSFLDEGSLRILFKDSENRVIKMFYNVRRNYPTGTLSITDSKGQTQYTSPGSPIEIALLDALRVALKAVQYEPPAGSITEDAEHEAKARYELKKHSVVAAIKLLEKRAKKAAEE